MINWYKPKIMLSLDAPPREYEGIIYSGKIDAEGKSNFKRDLSNSFRVPHFIPRLNNDNLKHGNLRHYGINE
ncbi:hypothetical protein J4461_04350 [Candidatus Pacearchaeota archaeon]|nr:hypothetical protein [Candidatus Pacearchaeota archaeon]